MGKRTGALAWSVVVTVAMLGCGGQGTSASSADAAIELPTDGAPRGADAPLVAADAPGIDSSEEHDARPPDARGIDATPDAGPALVTWNDMPVTAASVPSHIASMAYDAVQHLIVQVDDNGFTSTWDGMSWTAIPAAANETTLTGTMVTNVGVGQALWLVNGSTEIWNGSQWNGVNVTSPPLPRVDACMALDVAHARVVLFGGYSTEHSIDLGDTWTWDGSVWLEAHPVHSPGRLHGAGIAYDSARQRVVLFGGVADSTALSATWEWDGADWTQQAPTTSPPASLNDVAMTYDPDVAATVLFANDGTTWKWDGTDWTQLSPLVSPSPRSTGALAYDATNHDVVLFGGVDATDASILSDTWAFARAAVPTITVLSPDPALVNQSTLTFDFFVVGNPTDIECEIDDGGFAPCSSPFQTTVATEGDHMLTIHATNTLGTGIATRAFSTTLFHWTQVQPGVSPPERTGASLAYDSTRNRVVMYGGSSFSFNQDQMPVTMYYDETWEWDGSDWTQMTPMHSPNTASSGQSMTYDANKNVVVLFSESAQTWTWDGTDWTEQVPYTSPPSFDSVAMAYDSAAQNVMMFVVLETEEGLLSNELWQWDGSDWLQLVAPPSIATPQTAMTFDDATEQLMIVPLCEGCSWWTGDGTSWTKMTNAPLPFGPNADPGSIVGSSAVYDSAVERVVLFVEEEGINGGGSTSSWQWDGVQWKRYEIADAPTYFYEQTPVIYDSSSDETLLIFGNWYESFVETWRYAKH